LGDRSSSAGKQQRSAGEEAEGAAATGGSGK